MLGCLLLLSGVVDATVGHSEGCYAGIFESVTLVCTSCSDTGAKVGFGRSRVDTG
jgi:hypothetical protein